MSSHPEQGCKIIDMPFSEHKKLKAMAAFRENPPVHVYGRY